jgi:hypothetical protein
VARKARLNEDKQSGTRSFSRAQFEKNLGTKFCTTLVQKCDDRGIVITANLEFRKIFSDNNLQEVFEILYIMRNKFQRSHQAD